MYLRHIAFSEMYLRHVAFTLTISVSLDTVKPTLHVVLSTLIVVAYCAQGTDLNYWIKLLSCIIEANGGHIGLSHINLHWYY